MNTKSSFIAMFKDDYEWCDRFSEDALNNLYDYLSDNVVDASNMIDAVLKWREYNKEALIAEYHDDICDDLLERYHYRLDNEYGGYYDFANEQSVSIDDVLDAYMDILEDNHNVIRCDKTLLVD